MLAFESFACRGLEPGRVAAESRELYRLLTPSGEVLAEPTGALGYRAETREDLPVVGDWVASEHSVAGRRSGYVVADL